MTDLLRRNQAPLAAASWETIDDQAREVLTATLSARKIVGVSGPHGIEHAAVNLGRLDPGRIEAAEGVYYGIRRVLPLVEVRVPLVLDLWQLDDVVRGARDPDLMPLVKAARKLAAFEERAIYHGFSAAGIVGLAEASEQKVQSLPAESARWPEVIARATVCLETAGIAGPYVLVTAPDVYQAIEHDAGQYPLRKQIESLIGNDIVLAPYIDGAFLLPEHGSRAFELVLGQDAAVGFEEHHGQEVRLYLTESFTFRVLEPLAVVVFQPAS